jgi:hypothetical protein
LIPTVTEVIGHLSGGLNAPSSNIHLTDGLCQEVDLVDVFLQLAINSFLYLFGFRCHRVEAAGQSIGIL